MIPALFAQQTGQGMLWLPVWLGCGIVFYFALPAEPSWYIGIVFSLLAAAGCFLSSYVKDEAFYSVARTVAMAAAVAGVGFMAAQVRTAMVYTPVLEKKLGPVYITGRVEQVEQLPDEDETRLILKVAGIERLAPEKTPVRIRLRVRDARDLRPGDDIRVLGSLNPPSPPVLPGGFDFQSYAYFKGIGAFGFAFSKPEVIEKTEGYGYKLNLILENMREHIIRRVNEAVPPDLAPVTIALLTGERGAIAKEDNDSMRASGLYHMLSISGLHVGLAAGIVFFSIRFVLALFPALALRWPIKKIAASVAFLSALFYTVLVGAEPPTQRSLMMTGLVLMAVVFDRDPFSLRMVALAAIAVMLAAPEALIGPSFQMSFAAVILLIWSYENINKESLKNISKQNVIFKFFVIALGSAFTSVVATLATMPFSLFHFQQASLYGVISNAIAVPIMSFIIMPLSIVSYVLLPFNSAGPFLTLMGVGVDWVLRISDFTAALPGAQFYMPSWPESALAAFVVAGLWLVLWRGWGRLLAVVPLAFALIAIPIYNQADILINSDLKLIGIRQEGGSMAFSNGRTDRFSRTNWLRHQGHSPGGLLVWPKYGASPDIPGMQCDDVGCRWERKGVKVAFLRHPYALAEECAWADILIVPEPVPPGMGCRAPLIVDRFDVWRNGAYAIWIYGAGRTPVAKLVSAEDKRGDRPWNSFAGRHRADH